MACNQDHLSMKEARGYMHTAALSEPWRGKASWL